MLSAFRAALALLALAATLVLSGCDTMGDGNHVYISVPDQAMILTRSAVNPETGKSEVQLVAAYPVSTSKFGLGDAPGSNRTPLGRLRIASKIGASAPLGAVFKSRRPTGEVIRPDAPGRDPVVTRILWLSGLEPQNANAYSRCIYIHGTPEERRIGGPASFGCIRMASADVIRLFDHVRSGTPVDILNRPFRQNWLRSQPTFASSPAARQYRYLNSLLRQESESAASTNPALPSANPAPSSSSSATGMSPLPAGDPDAPALYASGN